MDDTATAQAHTRHMAKQNQALQLFGSTINAIRKLNDISVEFSKKSNKRKIAALHKTQRAIKRGDMSKFACINGVSLEQIEFMLDDSIDKTVNYKTRIDNYVDMRYKDKNGDMLTYDKIAKSNFSHFVKETQPKHKKTMQLFSRNKTSISHALSHDIKRVYAIFCDIDDCDIDDMAKSFTDSKLKDEFLNDYSNYKKYEKRGCYLDEQTIKDCHKNNKENTKKCIDKGVICY